jgi:arylsulfatase A-like enzyme
MKLFPTILCLLLAASPGVARAQVSESRGSAPQSDRPNILLIVGDNLGAWQLGCYGNQDVKTPYLDALSREGIRLTRAMSCNPVCSPTRASILTGLAPSQHGVHHWLLDGVHQTGPEARCLINEFHTLPEILSEAGYQCGLVGKWHLGGNLTPQEGFTHWNTMPSGLTKSFYGAEVIENGAIQTEPGNLTDYWTRQAVRYLRGVDRDAPFFLYLAYNGPYSLDPEMLVENPSRCRNDFTEMYANQQLTSFPREKPHAGLFKHTKELNNLAAIRNTAAQITALDAGIGKVVEELKELGLANNTLVVFTADQGMSGGHNGVWGMGHNAKPGVAYDSTMQIPLVCWRSGGITPGTCDFLVSNYDLMPTLLDYAGLPDATPKSSPGRSFAARLRGVDAKWEQAVFYEHFYLRSVRTDRWKYVWRHQEPDDLFDLQNDPEERNNLAADPEHREIGERLKSQIGEFFDKHADPRFDIWKEGKSQTWRPPFVEPGFVPVPNKTRYYEGKEPSGG